MDVNDKLENRARQYAQQNGLLLGEELASGIQGIVFLTESQPEKVPSVVQSVIKVHRREPAYCRERDVYLRLKEHGVEIVRHCHVPQLLGYDDALWVIQMTLVSQPFALDFASASLDEPPDFSEEVLADERAKWEELFESRWPEVQAIIGIFEGYGVYLQDVHPGNISFGD